jgi:hypothetical protein
MRAVYIVRLREIVLNEPLHVGYASVTLLPTEDLQIDARKVMIGIRVELALELRVWRDLHDSAINVRIRLVSRKAINLGILLHQCTQHVIERAVLHHENDDVLKVVQTSGHVFQPPKDPKSVNGSELAIATAITTFADSQYAK